MKRRALLFGFTAWFPGRAGEPRVIDVFTDMAASLTDGDAAGFMRPFDPAMPGVDTLRARVEALVSQAEVLSSIEFLSNEGDGASRAVELDWKMQLRERREAGRVFQRRQAVKCRLERRGRKWQITAFEASDLFAPPGPGRV
ncbi:MAG TPA: hypothetical protein VN442_22130 [Bryobacteraceae bacterium]|nr:hypothetical protein [Bryobacteraceae bacterium]